MSSRTFKDPDRLCRGARRGPLARFRRALAPRLGRAGRLALALLALAALAPASATAAPLAWSTPASADPGQTPTGIACPSEGLCVAIDHTHVLRTTDPAAPNPEWSRAQQIDPGHTLSSLACAPAGLCVTVDESGQASASTNPAAGAGGWTGPVTIDSAGLTGVSCPSAGLCVAVDQAGKELRSTDPGAASPTWSEARIDGSPLHAISCPSESLCVAVDAAGEVLVSGNPAAPSPAWSSRVIDAGNSLQAISCAGVSLCVAADALGNALVSADPGASFPTWSVTPIDLTGTLTGTSCATSGLCVLVDNRGAALASDDPAASIPTWNGAAADSAALVGVACLPGGFCVGIDNVGQSVRALVPAPTSATAAAVELTAGEATLTGTVNPDDAVLGECRFEYGTTTAYGQNASCANALSPVGGAQAVTARVAGLAPATTYHFRIVAANAGGVGVGADATFKTAAAVALVQPRPSIAGVPGIGERVRCNPGVSSGATATLTYAWVRDASTIAGATSSTYVIKPADAKHHLQCRVTATDAAGSATASSAFVSVPATGVLAAVGETSIGKLTTSGAQINVPTRCASRAPEGCAISLRVTITQTQSHKPHRHVTVTLVNSTVRLNQGQQRTIVLKLNSSGRRLLAQEHRLAVALAVKGTLIGVLKASLKNTAVTLRDPPSRHKR